MFYYGDIEPSSKVVVGFYAEDFHGEVLCNEVLAKGGVKIDQELHQHLVLQGSVKFLGLAETRIFTISDKSLFEKVAPEPALPSPPTTEERIAALEAVLMGVI